MFHWGHSGSGPIESPLATTFLFSLKASDSKHQVDSVAQRIMLSSISVIVIFLGVLVFVVAVLVLCCLCCHIRSRPKGQNVSASYTARTRSEKETSMSEMWYVHTIKLHLMRTTTNTSSQHCFWLIISSFVCCFFNFSRSTFIRNATASLKD